LSFIEISITCTLPLPPHVFDIFLLFSEDDYADTIFFLILFFIVILFFFIPLGMNIRYIFHDLQVEMIDFSFHHIDYSNEIDIIFLLKGGKTFSLI
jgi:hypothetical protein